MNKRTQIGVNLPKYVMYPKKISMTKKQLIFGLIIVAVVLLGWLFFGKGGAKQETITVHAGDFVQQVSVSGKVVATENLGLSFEQAGVVRSIPVHVGDSVSAGATLASQDTDQLSAQLSEMEAGIDLQKAKLNQLLAGASNEDIAIAQDGVTSAAQKLDSAYQSALIGVGSAYDSIYNAYTTALYLQNSYFYSNDQQGAKVQDSRNVINAILQNTKLMVDGLTNSQDHPKVDAGIVSMITALRSSYASAKIIRDQCDDGVYYSRVSATDKSAMDTQKTALTAALNDLTDAQQNISSYAIALQQAQNQLTLTKAQARPTDIAVFEAQIKQAEASAQNIVAQIKKRWIVAPINGVVTQVDAKVGSNIGAGVPAVSLISKDEFQIESYVPEIYIPLVAIGNDANITLDAYGQDIIFAGKVITIDPSETIKDGVATYKVTLQINDAAGKVKDGMTTNVLITTSKKTGVISVPQGMVSARDGKKFVNLQAGKTTVEREVTTGQVSSLGQVEITSGLSDGDVVAPK